MYEEFAERRAWLIFNFAQLRDKLAALWIPLVPYSLKPCLATTKTSQVGKLSRLCTKLVPEKSSCAQRHYAIHPNPCGVREDWMCWRS